MYSLRRAHSSCATNGKVPVECVPSSHSASGRSDGSDDGDDDDGGDVTSIATTKEEVATSGDNLMPQFVFVCVCVDCARVANVWQTPCAG